MLTDSIGIIERMFIVRSSSVAAVVSIPGNEEQDRIRCTQLLYSINNK